MNEQKFYGVFAYDYHGFDMDCLCDVYRNEEDAESRADEIAEEIDDPEWNVSVEEVTWDDVVKYNNGIIDG